MKLGRQHIHDNLLTIDQGKTDGSEEAHLEIPVHPKLREIIDATPTVGVKTFLVTHLGKPYTAPGFGNWFREVCDQADCGDERRLEELAAQLSKQPGCFDIIVDDGSHASYHQQLTMLKLFPLVKSGGLYIIEDLHWQPPQYEATLPNVPRTSRLRAKDSPLPGNCPACPVDRSIVW